MISLLLASSLALADSEIGTDRKFGLGVEVGNGTYLNVSGKYWLSEKTGIAFHAGTAFWYHEVGGRFEMVVYEGHWFDWADVPIWWFAGVDAGLYTATYTAPQVGITGGAAAALQFAKFPGEVFVQAGLGIFPVNYCSALSPLAGATCIVQGRGGAGFRYYF